MKERSFLARVDEILLMISKRIHLKKMPGSSMSLAITDEDGEMTGALRGLLAFVRGTYFYDGVPIDLSPNNLRLDGGAIIKVIAFVLCEAGIKVFDFHGRLIVATRGWGGCEELGFGPAHFDFCLDPYGEPRGKEISISTFECETPETIRSRYWMKGMFVKDRKGLLYKPNRFHPSTKKERVPIFSIAIKDLIVEVKKKHKF